MCSAGSSRKACALFPLLSLEVGVVSKRTNNLNRVQLNTVKRALLVSHQINIVHPLTLKAKTVSV